jgi:hypothetical protein
MNLHFTTFDTCTLIEQTGHAEFRALTRRNLSGSLNKPRGRCACLVMTVRRIWLAYT